MITLEELLTKILNRDLVQIILSDSQDKEFGHKIKIRPILMKGELLFQETLYRGTQVFHENYTAAALKERVQALLAEVFRQGEFQGSSLWGNVLVSKKGKMTIKTKQIQGKQEVRELAHNREKQYILREGSPVDFLVGLGVQTPEGKITKNRYDKFRQINRYLEFIEDVLDNLPTDRTIQIIDFGCGKSYLTFAMYYYLHELQKRDIRVTGLDLKRDVIEHCNDLARSCGYEYLSFEVGDISTYQSNKTVDMVVSLHACDTATDYAIDKAVKWGASVIMTVPCCQHELNKQISCKELQSILKYGLIKERISALVTDAIRANLLEEQGYDTQILEFIDMEHTPKNMLIRAVKRSGNAKMGKKNNVVETIEFLHVEPTLKSLLDK